LYGNYAFKLIAGDHRSALAEANAMCDEAERSANRVQKLIAYRLRGTSQVIMGDFRAGESTLEHAFSHFDPVQDKRLAWQHGTGPMPARPSGCWVRRARPTPAPC
jgi:hypothetical protein